MAWASLCTVEELLEGKGLYAEIDGFHLAVFLHNGEISVLDNNCPHANGPLSEGWIEDGCAVCPWHSWPFRLDNGEMRDSPGIAVTKYASRVLEFHGKNLVQADLPSF